MIEVRLASTRGSALPALILACVLGVASPPLDAQEPVAWGDELVFHTFSIVAVDPETGECGAAVASKYPNVGKVVPYVRSGVGAFCTQHYHNPQWGELALDLLQAGNSPEAVLAALLRDDPIAEQRQLAIMDIKGRMAVHNPTEAPQSSRYWGVMSGRFYSCQGNTLTGRSVISAMAAAYEKTVGSLTDRLMAALIAGTSYSFRTTTSC